MLSQSSYALYFILDNFQVVILLPLIRTRNFVEEDPVHSQPIVVVGGCPISPGVNFFNNPINWFVGVVCSDIAQGADIWVDAQFWDFGDVGRFKCSVDAGAGTRVENDREIDVGMRCGSGREFSGNDDIIENNRDLRGV